MFQLLVVPPSLILFPGKSSGDHAGVGSLLTQTLRGGPGSMPRGSLSGTICKKISNLLVLTLSQQTHINAVRCQDIFGIILWLFKRIKAFQKWTLWHGLLARGGCACGGLWEPPYLLSTPFHPTK